MKGLITIIFAFITFNLNAQDLTYEETQDIEEFVLSISIVPIDNHLDSHTFLEIL